MRFERLAQVTEVLGVTPVAAESTAERRIIGFSSDSRKISEGEVFIALSGENFDGHDYVGAAAGKGAAAAIVSKEWVALNSEISPAIPLIPVDDPLAAYGVLAREHRRSFRYPVVAVAGSNGKTTTKELIGAVLAKKYSVHRTTGNLNNLIGVPATMLQMNETHGAAVVEIGTNAPGEIATLCEILEPTHGIITNIGREHLELLGSIEGVAEEEGALFDYLEASGGLSFVNVDDAQLARISGSLPRRITYAIDNGADVRGKVRGLDESSSPTVEVEARGETIVAKLRLPGLHSAINAVAAAAVGTELGVPLEAIREALEGFQPLVASSGYARLAPVRAANGATVLNDTYNANPDSMLVAFATVAAMPKPDGGRKLLVLGDMRELGASSETEHRKLGEEIARIDAIDEVYLCGAEMRHAHEAIAGGRLRSHIFDDKRELIEALRASLQPSDIVLVKGSRGMKMEEVVGALV